jgi:AcrR family transcriptional regulator
MATDVKQRPTGREEVVDAVLDAADRLFSREEPGNVSLRAIARAADVNYGLVHRHFGTRDALLDRLLERYAERWGAMLERDDLDYEAALQELLGPPSDSRETGAYMRLLAWTLLSSSEGAEAHRRHATLDRLPGLQGAPSSDDPMTTTAAALALAFGWRFFHPFIEGALHLDRGDPRVHEAMRTLLRRLIDEED